MAGKKEDKRAFDAALDYLTRSARSFKEVKEKLYQKGYNKSEVDETMEKLTDYRFVNDEQYVKYFLDLYGNQYGRAKIIYKLTLEKGINKEIAETLVYECLSDEKELEKAVSQAKKYAERKKISDKKDAHKIGAYLYSRGFEWDIIKKSLTKINMPEEEYTP
ncbi:MAG: regulatory protein RecX [Clostridiales bacterium]|nr:regulatory protein RecX [Clostridiales bacterium]